MMLSIFIGCSSDSDQVIADQQQKIVTTPIDSEIVISLQEQEKAAAVPGCVVNFNVNETATQPAPGIMAVSYSTFQPLGLYFCQLSAYIEAKSCANPTVIKRFAINLFSNTPTLTYYVNISDIVGFDTTNACFSWRVVLNGVSCSSEFGSPTCNNATPWHNY